MAPSASEASPDRDPAPATRVAISAVPKSPTTPKAPSPPTPPHPSPSPSRSNTPRQHAVSRDAAPSAGGGRVGLTVREGARRAVGEADRDRPPTGTKAGKRARTGHTGRETHEYTRRWKKARHPLTVCPIGRPDRIK